VLTFSQSQNSIVVPSNGMDFTRSIKEKDVVLAKSDLSQPWGNKKKPQYQKNNIV